MTHPGAIVVCQALDCRPHMLVLNVEDDRLRTALLADLASETVQRLRRGHTKPVVQAVLRADAIETYWVPSDDVAPSPVLEGPP
ncbi:hypothetical protein NDI56_21045 [Haloarcula sp. S1CR25-12]|uniref:Uncharacterized protein n=1 Tax=Haloarcula saliterrae TaxID=2950534 RepID=A0ABU2FI29_9EURY|nr:hypothetical protein [Haloarcula sp. S1CR25-12]MDS0261896.1 hypothetical protein [Haloarcula sp. S1CR25-12]